MIRTNGQYGLESDKKVNGGFGYGTCFGSGFASGEGIGSTHTRLSYHYHFSIQEYGNPYSDFDGKFNCTGGEAHNLVLIDCSGGE